MENKLITIQKHETSKNDEAFAVLMKRTENTLNSEAKKEPDKYKQIGASGLELVSTEIIRQSCDGLPFNPDDIKLVSGQKFPDIIARKCYGVEVKSTNKNHWLSTGSSIVESTRVETVDNIYMLFGKLGGNPPEFKCRPYQDVLYEITVTHSPRYLINMELTNEQTIFSKMDISYDKFRTSSKSIEIVRNYYRNKAIQEGRQEMPWWLTSDNIDEPVNMTIRLWKSIPREEKSELMSKCLILFPETLHSNYEQFVLWLCAYRQIVIPNVRDEFSAGGRIKSVDGKTLPTPVPQIFNRIVKYSDTIKGLLTNPTKELIMLIQEYNPDLLNGNIYQNWLNQCIRFAAKYNAPIKDWIKDKPLFSF